MSIKATDPIVGPSRDDPDTFFAVFVQPDQKDKDYVYGVDKWARVAGIDNSLVYCQFCMEATEPGANSPGTSVRFNRDNNPAGIGIPLDTTNQPVVIANGDEAARIHVQCLYSLVKRITHPGVPIPPAWLPWFKSVWLPKVCDVQAPKVSTLADLNIRYVDATGESRATWAWDAAYLDGLLAYAAKWLAGVPDEGANASMPITTPAPNAAGGTVVTTPTPAPVSALNMTRDLIPLPDLTMDIITDAENNAWDNLGQKTVKGFVLHRQLGSNAATRSWFRRGAASTGLTEFGQAADGSQLLLWNSPLGYGGPGFSPNRAPWASGVFNVHGDSYGDGLAFEQKYGLNGINRDEVAWEIDGFYNDPWSDAAQQIAAHACAHYAHNYGIQWDQFPVHPQDGFSFVRWHNEITGPAEKICPGPVVMDATDAWIEKVRAIMKAAQTATTVQSPAPPPPAPQWAPKRPIGKQGPRALAVDMAFTATADVTPRQFADPAAPATAPDLKKGQGVTAKWIEADNEGNIYLVAAGGSRLVLSAFL